MKGETTGLAGLERAEEVVGMGALVAMDLYEGSCALLIGVFVAGVVGLVVMIFGGFCIFLTWESTVVVGKEVPTEKDNDFFPSFEEGVHCLSVAPFFSEEVDVIVDSAMAREASSLRAKSSVVGRIELEAEFLSPMLVAESPADLDVSPCGLSKALAAGEMLSFSLESLLGIAGTEGPLPPSFVGVVPFGRGFFPPVASQDSVSLVGLVVLDDCFCHLLRLLLGGLGTERARGKSSTLVVSTVSERVFIVKRLDSCLEGDQRVAWRILV